MDGIYELGLVVIFAAGAGIIMRFFRQPVVLAYLLVGFFLSFFSFTNLVHRESFSIFADLGIMLLLFLVGLEINFSSIKMVGKSSVLIGLGQIVITFLVGFVIGLLFSFTPLQAAYIAIALTFSSTIIVVKLLSEKKELNSLYGKLSIGFLLVQDFVAILLLVVLTGLEKGGVISLLPIFAAVVKGVALFILMLWLGRRIMPHIFDRLGRSQELLFVVSLAWVFLVALIVNALGFSIEVAGFLAGIALANSYEHFQIASHIRPLRDFFIMIFFVTLGASVVSFNFAGLGLPILVFSLFVLIGNPLIVLVLMGFLGYRRRTSFMAGVTMAQVSEFSLILAALGLKLGHINESVVGLITTVGAISIIFSTYLIIHGERIVKKLWKLLAFFERMHPKNEEALVTSEFTKPIILIGAQRIGHIIVGYLAKSDVLIVDFDPNVIDRFRRLGYTCLLGDISDRDIFETAGFEKADLVICTSPQFEDNIALLTELRRMPGRRSIILRADNDHESKVLYKAGADYVIRPHLTSGHYLGDLLTQVNKREQLWHAREKDFKYLKKEAHAL